jgi:UDP-N-acetylmuramoyl-tripeptide--D-alanyl-D-alanine ligase
MKDMIHEWVADGLNWLAKKLLQRHKPKIIGITGSVGKTNTKRAIAAVVEGDFATQWHDGNFNSEVGLPLALFELFPPKNLFNPFAWGWLFIRIIWKLLFWRYPYSLLVLELGIGKIGDMERFTDYIHPDIAVITAIQPAHIEGLGSIETVYREKMLLTKVSRHNIVNGDDELLHSFAITNPGTLEFGIAPHNNLRLVDIQRDKNHLVSFTIGGFKVKSNFAGVHNLLAFGAAWSVGEVLMIGPKTRVLALEELQPFPGRMNLLPGKKSSLIIDDSYNAVTPQAVIAAIDTLVDIKGKRKIAILGTMNELGSYTEDGHNQVGVAVGEAKLDLLITIGESAKKYLAKSAVSAGMNKDKIKSFMSPYEAGEFVAKLLKSKDVVLVKGSQNGVFAEEAAALLLKLDSDRSKLVRQSASWQAKKHQQFLK